MLTIGEIELQSPTASGEVATLPRNVSFAPIAPSSQQNNKVDKRTIVIHLHGEQGVGGPYTKLKDQVRTACLRFGKVEKVTVGLSSKVRPVRGHRRVFSSSGA